MPEDELLVGNALPSDAHTPACECQTYLVPVLKSCTINVVAMQIAPPAQPLLHQKTPTLLCAALPVLAAHAAPAVQTAMLWSLAP